MIEKRIIPDWQEKLKELMATKQRTGVNVLGKEAWHDFFNGLITEPPGYFLTLVVKKPEGGQEVWRVQVKRIFHDGRERPLALIEHNTAKFLAGFHQESAICPVAPIALHSLKDLQVVVYQRMMTGPFSDNPHYVGSPPILKIVKAIGQYQAREFFAFKNDRGAEVVRAAANLAIGFEPDDNACMIIRWHNQLQRIITGTILQTFKEEVMSKGYDQDTFNLYGRKVEKWNAKVSDLLVETLPGFCSHENENLTNLHPCIGAEPVVVVERWKPHVTNIGHPPALLAAVFLADVSNDYRCWAHTLLQTWLDNAANYCSRRAVAEMLYINLVFFRLPDLMAWAKKEGKDEMFERLDGVWKEWLDESLFFNWLE